MSVSLILTGGRTKRFSQRKQVYSAEPLTPKPHALFSWLLLRVWFSLIARSYLLEAVSITEIVFSPSLHCYRADAVRLHSISTAPAALFRLKVMFTGPSNTLSLLVFQVPLLNHSCNASVSEAPIFG